MNSTDASHFVQFQLIPHSWLLVDPPLSSEFCIVWTHGWGRLNQGLHARYSIIPLLHCSIAAGGGPLEDSRVILLAATHSNPPDNWNELLPVNSIASDSGNSSPCPFPFLGAWAHPVRGVHGFPGSTQPDRVL